jgi:hypothetical protein
VGNGVLLAFDPEVTLRGDLLPPHGGRWARSTGS